MTRALLFTSIHCATSAIDLRQDVAEDLPTNGARCR